MYQLNYILDGFTYGIYDPRVEELVIRDVSVHLAVGEAGSMRFTIGHDHPCADKLRRLRGRLELLSGGAPIFRGRILSDTLNFDRSRTVEAEGQLACLNDSLTPPFEFPAESGEAAEYAAENVVESFLGKLLERHNSQVTQEQQVLLGEVTVRDPNNYIARSSTGYATTWETITGKLASSALGGHLLVRYELDGTYLDYLADFPLSNTQGVQFAENLLELSDEIDAVEVYTAVLPVGKDGLTIADLEDGDLTDDLVKEGAVIYSKAGVAQYGRITAVQTWDDVTEAANLRAKAAALLAQSGVLPLRTVSVTAVDLHCTDSDVAALRVGRYTQVSSAPHGLEARFVLTELEPDLLDPGNTRITLGASVRTQTDRVQGELHRLDSADDRQQAELDRQQTSLETLAQTTETRFTEIIQNSREVILSALEEYATTSDLDSLRETVQSQLTLLAGQIELRFTQTSERIEDVDGDLQARYNELSKYFRFTAGGLVVGEEGNELTLRVDNDRISFLDGGLEVAYITGKKLYITDAHFLSSLRVGKFAWVPRESGNLSLVKVGD